MNKAKSNEAIFNSNNEATSSDISNPVTEKTVPFKNSKWQSNIALFLSNQIILI